jgi:hypothetical protein
MTRKAKDGKLDKRHGGYRHGVPGGDAAKVRVEARLEPDRKERWEAAAALWWASTGGAEGDRRIMTAFLVEAVEAYIQSMGTRKNES